MTAVSPGPHNPGLWRVQLCRFAAVGALTFIVDTAVFLLARSTVLAAAPVRAKVVAVLVAGVIGYVLHRGWSFRARGGRGRTGEAALYFAVCALAVLLNAAPLRMSRYWLLLAAPAVSPTTEAVADVLSAQVVGTAVAMGFRWWALRRWVFPPVAAESSRDPGCSNDAGCSAAPGPGGGREGPMRGGAATLVVVPTYNERDNLASLVARVHRAVTRAEILVVDDASPDGTGHLADELARTDPRVRVLHRGGRAGLGTAYVAGFSWALEHGYARVAQMDADGSHAPEQLPLLLQAAADADVVLGSRYVAGGRTQDWPRHRRALSQLGNLYARRALGTDLRDMTGGCRVFHRHVLAELPLAEVASQGYCFQVDLAWRACRGGYRIREAPITFTERRTRRRRRSNKRRGRCNSRTLSAEDARDRTHRDVVVTI